MADSPWPAIHAERDALAADLASIDQAGWDTPSMCSRWTVRQTLGHMTATARMTPPQFFLSMARSGFSFDKMTDERDPAGRRLARPPTGSPPSAACAG